MQIESKEQLSLLMDGEFTDKNVLNDVLNDESLQSCWHRYHVVRGVMRGELHNSSLTLDISKQVAQAIANEDIYQPLTDEQPKPNEVVMPKVNTLFWVRVKDVIGKISQVGLAACVTLAIIAGVQYHQDQTKNDNGVPTLNTVPVGVNIAPVGGITQQNDQQLLEKKQYDKIRLLVQDYELQKRLNAH
ncbi:hypothetical protein A9G11_10785 [Gilliamella sp. wkB108]|uniref:RseA family anti-sigma factor n=1 Tax=Gilliamella sp. wkB108 TaxID=3120256 RepID=UPI00080E5713|nr:RseA family anti-sigma factor [Gilliamella apicola]OCG28298.1 hypothetical protein A9G11_10785 [Gilliamella apicola]